MAEREESSVDERRQRQCPWCGAPNPLNAQRCVSCGSWLVSEVKQADDAGGTIIDVSGDEPYLFEEPGASTGRFGSIWYTDRRGMFVRGGRRGCLLATILLLLFVCVQCVFVYYLLRWIF